MMFTDEVASSAAISAAEQHTEWFRGQNPEATAHDLITSIGLAWPFDQAPYWGDARWVLALALEAKAGDPVIYGKVRIPPIDENPTPTPEEKRHVA